MAKGKQSMSALVIRMGFILSTATQGEGREGGLGTWGGRAEIPICLSCRGLGGEA